MSVLGIDIGYRNFAFCLLTVRGEKSHVARWDLVDLVQSFNGGRKPKDLQEHRWLMYTCLETLFPDPLETANVVVVERQPPPPHGTVLNLVLAEVVLAYFQVPLRQQRNLRSRLQAVSFVDPKVKFPNDLSVSYAERKLWAVRRVAACFRHPESATDASEMVWSRKFSLSEQYTRRLKLDDLADAFLLARYGAALYQVRP